MRKFTAVVTLLGTLLIPVNYSIAGCEQSLPNLLQACFNSNQAGLQVSVANGYLFITGSGSTLAGQSLACVEQYNAGAVSCPGAPFLFVSTQMERNQQTNNSGSR